MVISGKFRMAFSLNILFCIHLSLEKDYDTAGYVVAGLVGEASDLQDMKALFEEILSDYDTRIRPRLNQSQSVNVDAVFIPNAIVNFDTTGQKIDVMGFFRVSWTDDITKWNASAFGGTNTVMVPVTDIWYPRLIIDRAYNGNGVIGDKYTDIVRITDTGRVQWVPNGIYGFLCDADVTFYPNDVQTCDLQLYVTDQTVSKVELHSPPEVTLNDFTENSEWRLLKATSSVKFKYGTNIVSVRFQIERRSAFAIYTIVIPLFTLSLLSIVTFIVPVESGEKGSLSITIFLAYGFFIAITRDSLPHNSLGIPYFVIYICALLMLSVITVLYVMLESKIYHTIGTKAFHYQHLSCSQYLLKSIRVAQSNQKSEENKFNSSGRQENTAKKQTRNTKYGNINKTPTENNTRVHIPDNKQSIEDGKDFTWADLLRLANTILFCITFIFLVIFTAVLWTKVMNRN